MRWCCGLGLFAIAAAGVLVSSRASAAKVFSFSVGAKGFAGGNLWTKPSNVPEWWDGHGFGGDAGGFGWGAGIYGEARFIKFIGLELGLTYDKSTLYRDIDTTINVQGYPYKPKVQSREKVDFSSMRIPLLIKGILPLGIVRLSVFVGPEFIVPTSVSGGVEQTGGDVKVTNFHEYMRVEKAGSTMATMGLGLTIELPFHLDLPIELRASKNLSQPSPWSDRVAWAAWDPDHQNIQTPYTVKAQSSWDFRAGLGLAYRY